VEKETQDGSTIEEAGKCSLVSYRQQVEQDAYIKE
jgi:hypothetical protein